MLACLLACLLPDWVQCSIVLLNISSPPPDFVFKSSVSRSGSAYLQSRFHCLYSLLHVIMIGLRNEGGGQKVPYHRYAKRRTPHQCGQHPHVNITALLAFKRGTYNDSNFIIGMLYRQLLILTPPFFILHLKLFFSDSTEQYGNNNDDDHVNSLECLI